MAATIARAVSQLAGTLTNPATSLPYTNSATLGTNSDGSYNIDTVLNFNDNGTTAGNFPDDTPFPGLDPSNGPYDFFSTEALLFLDLPAGYYRLGVNSDDGFQVNVLPVKGSPGSPILLGQFDGGRGAADTLFDFLVQQSGVYNFQVIYFEDKQAASCEFFSVTNLTTGDKVLINDLTSGNPIKSYRAIPPRIASVVKNGSNLDIQWAYGTPPYQVQAKTDINGSWSNVGGTTTSQSASIAILPGARFFQVLGSP
jgi:hypothetical protein